MLCATIYVALFRLFHSSKNKCSGESNQYTDCKYNFMISVLFYFELLDTLATDLKSGVGNLVRKFQNFLHCTIWTE